MKNKTYLAIALIGISIIPVFSNASPTKDFFSKEEMLIEACKELDVQVVRELLEKSVNINCQDEYGKTPIRIALGQAACDDLKMAFKSKVISELIFAKNPDLNIQDEWGQTILWDYSDNYDFTKKLLEKGANPNIKDKDCCTPLMEACDEDLIHLYVENGADIDAVNNEGRNAFLHSITHCCRSGTWDDCTFYLEQIYTLVELGCNTKLKDNDGCNALMLACKERIFPIVQFCFEKGFNLNEQDQNGFTPLMHAIKSDSELGTKCQEMIIAFLIEHGANVNLKDKDGKTVLMHLVEYWSLSWFYPSDELHRFFDTFKLIIHPRNINVRNTEGNTALSMAKQEYENQEYPDYDSCILKDIIDLLIAHGATE